ncbi:MAG: lipopolysaccharide transport periplasmic protein LptA, partial [Acidiferrobacterales bacterium]
TGSSAPETVPSHPDCHRWIWVCLLSVIPSLGLGEDSPIYLRAQHITVDQRTGTSTYQGNVRLKRGQLSFAASRATVNHRNGDIDTIKAYGNPVIVNKRDAKINTLTTVSGRRLIYLAAPNTIIVTGKVITRQGKDVIQSAKVTYDIENDTLVATGLNRSLRVNAAFHTKHSASQAGRPEI